MRAAAVSLAVLILGLTGPSALARTEARLTVEGESVGHWRGERSVDGRLVTRIRVFLDDLELDGTPHGNCTALFRRKAVTVKWTICGKHVRMVVANVGAAEIRVHAWWRYAKQ